LRRRRDVWRIVASATRRALDYLRVLERDSPGSSQARKRAPRLLRALLFVPPFRWRFGRWTLAWVLERLEAGLPIAGGTKAVIKDWSPEVVLVSPRVLASPEAEFIRSAHATRTPSVLVLTWDHMVPPDAIRDVPTLTLVADDRQAEDVADRLGIPRDHIQVVRAEGRQDDKRLSAPTMADAIDAARTREVDAPPGRLLRPILWALTPLLVLALPVLRPTATLHSLATGIRRTARRVRRRTKTKRKTRRQSPMNERAARMKSARERKAVRAAEKRRKREQRGPKKPPRAERGENV
jgi:hypothetical protein